MHLLIGLKCIIIIIIILLDWIYLTTQWKPGYRGKNIYFVTWNTINVQ